MRWGKREADRRERERELVEAEQEVAELKERAEKVGDYLAKRYRRNFWGETAAAIARREP